MSTDGSNISKRFGGRQDAARLTTNGVSFAVLACSGIIINTALAGHFGVDTVGQFNQLTALHLVVAQIAAFGIHLSCLHYLSAQAVGSEEWETGARSAVWAVAIVGSTVAVMVALGAGLIEKLLGSPGVAAGVRWVAPAVALFGLNKVLLAIFNAGDRLHVVALLQAMRPTVWLIGTAVTVNVGNSSPAAFGQILFSGELLATLFGLVLLSSVWRRPILKNHFGWLLRHLRFGIQAMLSHLITELNTRVDVLVLALFVNDSLVGIYSFVALLAEGVFQVGVVIRTVINRRLVEVLAGRDYAGLKLLGRQTGCWSLILTMLVTGLLIAGFSPAISLLELDPTLLEGELALRVLLGGVLVCSPRSPFWMILIMAGKPIEHTKLMIVLCVLSIGLNVALIPLFGILGAASGTAIMLATFPFMLAWSVNRVLGVIL